MKKGLKTRVPPSWCNSILECEKRPSDFLLNGETASKAVGMCLCGRVLSHIVKTIGPPAADLHVKAFLPRPPSSWLKTSLFHMKEVLGGFYSFYPSLIPIHSAFVFVFHKKSPLYSFISQTHIKTSYCVILSSFSITYSFFFSFFLINKITIVNIKYLFFSEYVSHWLTFFFFFFSGIWMGARGHASFGMC